jgi:PAS domain-containing protein
MVRPIVIDDSHRTVRGFDDKPRRKPSGLVRPVAQYIGGVYMLMAVLAAAREGGEWDAALQSALKESQERYRILAEATFEGIVIIENGEIIDANEQFCRMLGYAEGEVIGKKVADLIPAEDRRHFLSTVHSGQGGVGEYIPILNTWRSN